MVFFVFFFLHCREVQTTTVKPNNPRGSAEQTQAERSTHVACVNHSGAKLASSRSLLGLKKPDWLFVLEARAHAQEEGARRKERCFPSSSWLIGWSVGGAARLEHTSENATLSWINTDSLAVAEISSQRDEERYHGTTQRKVGKTACHLERDRTAGAGETSGSDEK